LPSMLWIRRRQQYGTTAAFRTLIAAANGPVAAHPLPGTAAAQGTRGCEYLVTIVSVAAVRDSVAFALAGDEDGFVAGDPLLARARQIWVELAGVPVAFRAAGGIEVAVSAGSLLCPPGWVGIVALGGAAIVTVPEVGLVEVVRAAFDGLAVASVTDPDRLRVAAPVVDVLGPASLAYLDGRDHRPARPAEVEEISGDHADLAALLASVTADEADECGLAGISSAAFVVRSGTRVVAAAGYRRWPGEVAHLCVLTAPQWRGRGLARVVASAAVADSLADGLLPQWRARPEPSRRVAHALGFRELGGQLSIRIGA